MQVVRDNGMPATQWRSCRANLVREDDFHGVGFDEKEGGGSRYQVSTREPWNKKQPIMISKDAAPIISFPMKNPTIGTVNTA